MSQYTELAQVKRAVIRLLARREHSKQELLRKLQKYCEQPQMLDDVISYCESEGYQSDSRFAQMIIRTRADQGYGRRKAEMELKTKGVSPSIAVQAFSEVDIDWFCVARDCFERKYTRKYDPSDRKSHDKCTRSMLGRGFDFDQIKYAQSGD